MYKIQFMSEADTVHNAQICSKLINEILREEKIGKSTSWIRKVIAFSFPTPKDEVMAKEQSNKSHLLAEILMKSDAAFLLIFKNKLYELCDWHQESYKEWAYLQPQDLGNNWVVWALASFHYNGYVREQALRNLASLEGNMAIPFLFFRMTDWVEEISQFAAVELIKRLDDSHAPAIIYQLPFWAKIKHSIKVPRIVFEMLERYFKRNARIQQYLKENYSQFDGRIKRVFLSYLIEGISTDKSTLIIESLNDKDITVRMFALNEYKRFIDDSEAARQYYEAMIVNPWMPIRRAALFIAAKWKLQEPQTMWRQTLMDPHSSIRDLAQFNLRELGLGQEAAALYRDKIREATNSSKSLSTAILGLGETGTREDIDLVAPFLKNSSNKVVLASVISLDKLGAENELQSSIYDLLEHSSVKVSRDAYKVLLRKPSWLDISKLRKIFQENSSDYVKRHILYLSEYFTKWEQIHFLLENLNSSNEDFYELMSTQILKWVRQYNKAVIKPTVNQLVELRELLFKSEDILKAVNVRWDSKQTNLFNVLKSFLEN